MVGERPVQRGLQPLVVCLLLPRAFCRGARFGDKPRVVPVQLHDFVLLDDQRLVRLSQFGLQLLDLLLVSACFLFALLLAGHAVVLKRVVRVLEFLLERAPEAVVFGQMPGQVVHLLREAFDIERALLQHGLRVGVGGSFAIGGGRGQLSA